MSTLILLAICSGVNDPIVAETPARAFQLFARQTRLSVLLGDFAKTGTGEVPLVRRRSADPVTDIALQLADEQLQFALFRMRHAERNPYIALQRDRVERLSRALAELEQAGRMPNRDRILRELETMAATTSTQINERLTIYTDANPQVELLRQRLQAITELVDDYKQDR